MRPFMTIVPVTLVIASSAFAQAGAEGEYDLLLPDSRTTAGGGIVRPSAPPPVLAVAAPSPAPAPVAAAPEIAQAPAAPAATTRITVSSRNGKKGVVGDYDFGEVVQTLQASVRPLATELDQSFPRFVGQIDDAIALMEQGRNTEAVALSANAIDGVLAARDGVVNPLWEAQFYLNEQIAVVRTRLAASLTTDDPSTAAGKAKAQTDKMLDQVAARISQTKDPIRKKRLIAHYRTMRTLSKVRANTVGMSPDQRKLWFGVLRVLEQASLAHQQVLMGSESLFAQLDGTASQLRDYLGLMQTMEGVDALLGSVQGAGLEGFVEGMRTLQEQMESFSTSMQGALESSMMELESRVDSMSEMEAESGGVMAPSSIDDELQSRIDRVGAPAGAGKE
jgi:hypothetical protein